MVSSAVPFRLRCAGLVLALAAAPLLSGAEAERNVSVVRSAPRASRLTLAVNAAPGGASPHPTAGTPEPRGTRQELPLATWGQVSGEWVNVRSGPGTPYDVVLTLRGGDYIRASARLGNWIEIEWPSAAPAWVAKDLLGPQGVILGDQVRIRSSGHLNASILREAKRGERMEILGEAGAWYKVKAPSGAKAYLHGKYAVLGVRPPAPVVVPESREPLTEARATSTSPAAPSGQAVLASGNALPTIETPLLASAALGSEPETKASGAAGANGAAGAGSGASDSAPASRLSTEPQVASAQASVLPGAQATALPLPANVDVEATQVDAPAAKKEVLALESAPPAVAEQPKLLVVQPAPSAVQPLPAETPVLARPGNSDLGAPPEQAAPSTDSFGELLPPPHLEQAGDEDSSAALPSVQGAEVAEVREGGLLYKTRDAFATAGRVLAHTPGKIARSATGAYATVKPKVAGGVTKAAGAAQGAGHFIGSQVNHGFVKTKDFMLGKPKTHEQAAGPDTSIAAAPAAASSLPISSAPPVAAAGVERPLHQRPTDLASAAASGPASSGSFQAQTPVPPVKAPELPRNLSSDPPRLEAHPERARLPYPLGEAPRAERLPAARKSQVRPVENAPLVIADGLLESITASPLAETNHRLLKDGATVYELQADPALDLNDYLGRRVEVVGTRSNEQVGRGQMVLCVIRIRALD